MNIFRVIIWGSSSFCMKQGVIYMDLVVDDASLHIWVKIHVESHLI